MGVPISPVRILRGLLLTLSKKDSANILDPFELRKDHSNYFFQFKQSVGRSTRDSIDILCDWLDNLYFHSQRFYNTIEHTSTGFYNPLFNF